MTGIVTAAGRCVWSTGTVFEFERAGTEGK